MAAELEFATRTVRYHTGGGALEIFPGRIFDGVGGLGRISNASETEALADSRLELAITGLDPSGANLASIFLEDIRGRPATLWLVMINNASGEIVEVPTIVYRGRLDNFVVRQGATLSIGVHVENVLADWDRERELRFTDPQQRDRFPDDKGLEFVPTMAEKELPWGRT